MFCNNVLLSNYGQSPTQLNRCFYCLAISSAIAILSPGFVPSDGTKVAIQLFLDNVAAQPVRISVVVPELFPKPREAFKAFPSHGK